jgi:Tol biopolymer transport system component
VRPDVDTEAWYLWPDTLPDNKGILFTIWRGGHESIAVLTQGAAKPRVLVENGARARVLPTGHLVYVSEGHLFAVPFDDDKVAIRAGAVVVVDDVYQTPTTAGYDVSRDGTLVYLPAGLSAYDIVWRDRHGTTTSSLGTGSRQYNGVALSRDGERLAVGVTEGTSRSIWVGNVANGLLTRLTFGNDDVFELWSRDSKRVIYSVGQNNYNLFWTAADGSGTPERLTESQRPENPTGVSPDGDRILFNQVEPTTGSDIWELSISRKESHPLVKTPFNEGSAVFSEDGHWIAYQSDESGRSEVYVQAYPGGGQKRRVSVDGGALPFWGRTGRELFYQTATAVFAVPIGHDREFSFGTPQRLFEKMPSTRTARFTSLDDQRFLIVEKARTNQSARLNMVENWFDELIKAVPIK